jgi:hypothetical protein
MTITSGSIHIQSPEAEAEEMIDMDDNRIPTKSKDMI